MLSFMELVKTRASTLNDLRASRYSPERPMTNQLSIDIVSEDLAKVESLVTKKRVRYNWPWRTLGKRVFWNLKKGEGTRKEEKEGGRFQGVNGRLDVLSLSNYPHFVSN